MKIREYRKSDIVVSQAKKSKLKDHAKYYFGGNIKTNSGNKLKALKKTERII